MEYDDLIIWTILQRDLHERREFRMFSFSGHYSPRDNHTSLVKKDLKIERIGLQ